MVKLELDIDRIEKQLLTLDRNRAWLGKKIAASNATMYYIWKNKSALRADQIAEAIGLPLKVIIKHVEVPDAERNHQQNA